MSLDSTNNLDKNKIISYFSKKAGFRHHVNRYLFLKRLNITKFSTEFGRKLSYIQAFQRSKVGYVRAKNLGKLKKHAKKKKLCRPFKTYRQKWIKIKKKKRKRVVISKQLYYIIIRKVSRNIFICIHDGVKKKLLKSFSFGSVSAKRSKKASAQSAVEVASLAALHIQNILKNNIKSKYFIIILKSPPSKEIFQICSTFKKLIPHLERKTLAFMTYFKSQHGGGLRPKKMRRL